MVGSAFFWEGIESSQCVNKDLRPQGNVAVVCHNDPGELRALWAFLIFRIWRNFLSREGRQTANKSDREKFDYPDQLNGKRHRYSVVGNALSLSAQ